MRFAGFYVPVGRCAVAVETTVPAGKRLGARQSLVPTPAGRAGKPRESWFLIFIKQRFELMLDVGLFTITVISGLNNRIDIRQIRCLRERYFIMLNTTRN